MEKKKSYLSKQAIAAIVIATVVAVALPVYFFLVKPMLDKPVETPPTVYEPLLENEKHTGVNSQYERGGWVYLFNVGSADEQIFNIRAKTGDWSYSLTANGLYIKDYESIVPSDGLSSVCSTMRSPIGVHVAPSSEFLLQKRAEKAAGMSAEKLEEIGGINQLKLTYEEIAGIEIDFDQFGLGEGADSYSFNDNDGKIHTVYLGDYAANGVERYARIEGVNAVYKLTSRMTEMISCTLFDAMPVTLTDVTVGAPRGDYIPDRFSIIRDGEIYVDISKFSGEDAIEKDRMTTSLLTRTYTGEDGKKYVNYYDTSAEYSTMLYKFFRASISGEEVVGAPKSKMAEVDGEQIPVHGDFTPEEYASFGINPDKPYRVLFTAKYTDDEPDENGDLPALVNYLVFSTPFEENGEKYYNVYNTNRATVVRVKASKMPFIDENEEYYVGRYVSVISMDSVDTMTVDSTKMPDFMVGDGVERFSESFTLDYRMNGKERERDNKNRMQIDNILLSDGSAAPAVADGTSAVENFRIFYYHFGAIRLFTNVERYLSKIERIDTENADLTLTYSVWGKDRTHTMRFYFFDEAGIWAFYTVDGEGRYIARTEDIKIILKGLMLVRTGGSVEKEIGEVGG